MIRFIFDRMFDALCSDVAAFVVVLAAVAAWPVCLLIEIARWP